MQVLLADDQQNVRAALRLLLEQEPDIQVVGEAADAAGLLLAIERHRADLLLLDCELPGIRLRHLLYLLRHERPFLTIIGMSTRPESRRSALQAGADAFLSKSTPPNQIVNSLRQWHRKSSQMSEPGASPDRPTSLR